MHPLLLYLTDEIRTFEKPLQYWQLPFEIYMPPLKRLITLTMKRIEMICSLMGLSYETFVLFWKHRQIETIMKPRTCLCV